MAQRLPNYTGFSSITTNLGEVHNSGVELTLNSVNIKNKDFEWTTSAGFSYNKNTIKHLPTQVFQPNTSEYFQVLQQHRHKATLKR